MYIFPLHWKLTQTCLTGSALPAEGEVTAFVNDEEVVYNVSEEPSSCFARPQYPPSAKKPNLEREPA